MIALFHLSPGEIVCLLVLLGGCVFCTGVTIAGSAVLLVLTRKKKRDDD